MKILKIQALRGPNIWSIRRKKLIQMRLDLEEMEELPTNKISGFRERLEALLPSLIEHRCSEGVRGGFFMRVDDGTWMGHVIEHIALEIQTLAGMDTGFGRTRETKEPGVYNVVFSYLEERVGLFAAESAVSIAQALIDGTPYDIESDIQKMKEIRENVRLGPSTGSIVDEAASRDIPWIRLGTNSLVQLGYGVHQMRFQATITCNTSNIAVDIACDKEDTKRMLENSSIPVASGAICVDEEDLIATIDKIGYPIVIKPLGGNHGKGASINVKTLEAAKDGLLHAQRYGRRVLVEKFISGFDFRVLVIDHKMVAAAQRVPAHVVGDGLHTIQQLIDFAHNPNGYLAIEDFLSTVESPLKIGIIAGVGDRRDEDIRECGKIAGRMFDHIIIRQEKHLRGRTEEEIINLILEGIHQSNKDITYEIIPKEVEAIKHAINNAQDGTFITALSDVVTNAIEIVQSYLDKESENALIK